MNITMTEIVELVAAGAFAGVGSLFWITSMWVVRYEEDGSLSNILFLTAVAFLLIFVGFLLVFFLHHL